MVKLEAGVVEAEGQEDVLVKHEDAVAKVEEDVIVKHEVTVADAVPAAMPPSAAE